MVVDRDGELLKVQVKHAVLRDGCVRFRAYSSTGKGHDKIVKSYRGDVDLFGVYCSDNDAIYLIPVEDVSQHTPT